MFILLLYNCCCCCPHTLPTRLILGGSVLLLFVCLLACFVAGDQFMACHFKEHFCSRLHAFSAFFLSVESKRQIHQAEDEVFPLNQ